MGLDGELREIADDERSELNALAIMNGNLIRGLRMIAHALEVQMSAIDDLKAAEQADAAATAAAVQKISDLAASVGSLSQQLNDAIASGDPTAVETAAQAITQHASDLQAAVTAATTPAAPADTPAADAPPADGSAPTDAAPTV